LESLIAVRYVSELGAHESDRRTIIIDRERGELTIGQCLNGGYGWLEIECCRCKTRASMPLDAIRRARDTPIWKLEASFRCRSCGTRRYKPPVRMIKLTERRGITPCKWGSDEER